MTQFAAVCSYFNPCGYKNRRRNFDAFRQNMEVSGVRLMTVELAFDPDQGSELGTYGDVVLIRGGDVMWQKERLLQIGIDKLFAEGYSAIAWVDADIVFEQKNWHENVLRALENSDIVQSFDRLISHYPEGPLVRPGAARDRRSWAHGGSWAASHDFWEHVKLYQHCILGGGDTVMANAMFQCCDPRTPESQWPHDNVVFSQISAATREHISAWARRSWGRWRVGYVPNQTAHLLPHGSRRHRYHVKRWQFLKDYNPATDIIIASSGAFRWSSDKPQLHHSVLNYFAARREDDP